MTPRTFCSQAPHAVHGAAASGDGDGCSRAASCAARARGDTSVDGGVAGLGHSVGLVVSTAPVFRHLPLPATTSYLQKRQSAEVVAKWTSHSARLVISWPAGHSSSVESSLENQATRQMASRPSLATLQT